MWRIKLRLSPVAFAFVLVTLTPARAQETPIVGVGQLPCAMLLASEDKPEARLAYVNWAFGMLSGLATAEQNNMLDGRDPDAIEERLVEVCRQSPSTFIAAATLRVATSLARRKEP